MAESKLDDLLVTYKPSGLKTHQSSPNDWGYVEWLEEKKGLKLFLFQRLDAGTSGLLLIAKNEETARTWTEKLKNKSVQKEYLLITQANPLLSTQIRVCSHISKQNGTWRSEESLSPNSETEFSLVKNRGRFQLWRAHPRTGKAHQIRLHAQSLGIPILGDREHGGPPFFRLCLHANRLLDPEAQGQWSMPAPPFFDDLSLLDDPPLCALLDAIHQRQQLEKNKLINSESFRLAHQEFPFLRLDQYGQQIWAYDYSDNHSGTKLVQKLYDYFPARPTWIREMTNRGGHPNHSNLTSIGDPKTPWLAQENGITYELRAHQGMSPGLFLDQRENRQWVRKTASGKKTLNLFSYTCGFSLCAAVGGATEVISVDVSRTFLDWGKTNFQLNNLNPEQYEFWASDSLDFLNRTAKIKRRFDLIICDPPSFGRSKRGVFKVEQDFAALVQLCFSLLAENGQLLISTNYEKWDYQSFYDQATQKLPRSSFSVLEAPKPGLDFLEPKQSILKTMILQKS